MSLSAELQLGDRELIALTGGGGKTSLLMQIADELVERAPVLVTTTTKLGIDQTEDRPVCWSVHEAAGALRDRPDRPVCVFAGTDGPKLHGFAPQQVDQMFRSRLAPYVLVEADGSRRRPLKAPAAHEPVVPGDTSLVVVVAGIDAVGSSYAEAAHRPDDAVRLTGATVDDAITVEAVAGILTHPAGGLKGIPPAARVAIALTKVDAAMSAAAERVRALVAKSDRIDRVVLVPFDRRLGNDDNVVEPGHLPTPFSADQIRAGCPVGREIRLAVVEAEETYVRVIRFVEADADGAVQTSRTIGRAGESASEPSVVQSSWDEYQRHASFPAAATSMVAGELQSPLGRLACRIYEMDDGASVTRFWFDVDRPGMPVRVETRHGEQVTFTMEMISDSVG